MIVGGEAVIFYGYPRLTGDVDFFFNAALENTHRLFDALTEFWSGNIPGLTRREELGENGLILQFGRPPNRIDLINRIDGIEFQEAWPGREIAEMQSKGQTISVVYIGLQGLIRNKSASARPKDLDDLDYLKKK